MHFYDFLVYAESSYADRDPNDLKFSNIEKIMKYTT